MSYLAVNHQPKLANTAQNDLPSLPDAQTPPSWANSELFTRWCMSVLAHSKVALNSTYEQVMPK